MIMPCKIKYNNHVFKDFKSNVIFGIYIYQVGRIGVTLIVSILDTTIYKGIFKVRFNGFE